MQLGLLLSPKSGRKLRFSGEVVNVKDSFTIDTFPCFFFFRNSCFAVVAVEV